MSLILRDQSRRRTIAAFLAMAFIGSAVSAACSEEEENGSSSAGTNPPAAPQAQKNALETPEIGPLAGLRWPAVKLQAGTVLHDDGNRLLAYDRDGRQRIIWRHPRASVTRIAASPGGAKVALAVALAPQRPGDPSFALYLLDDDGTVRTVDVVEGFRTIESPIFVARPGARKLGSLLAWLRVGDEVDPRTASLDAVAMMALTKRPTVVDVVLRFGEAPVELHGFPGSPNFSITLIRTDNAPTQFEVIVNHDYGNAEDATLTRWGEFAFEENTDAFSGVAWLSPTDFVVPVAQHEHPGSYSLRLHRLGCDYYGSHVVYRGNGIDWGFAEAPWVILPLTKRSVLVLSARDAHAAAIGTRSAARWLEIDVRTGKITRSNIRWRVHLGPRAWAVVSPNTRPKVGRADCEGFNTYP